MVWRWKVKRDELLLNYCYEVIYLCYHGDTDYCCLLFVYAYNAQVTFPVLVNMFVLFNSAIIYDHCGIIVTIQVLVAFLLPLKHPPKMSSCESRMFSCVSSCLATTAFTSDL